MLRLAAWLFLFTLSSCATDPDPACQSLVASSPKDWSTTLAPVTAIGNRAVPALIRALHASPGAPGEQAAIAALSTFKHPRTRPFLENYLRDGGAQASEAALSLGRLGDSRSRPLLDELCRNTKLDGELRTAAACALLDLGETHTSLPFLRAVLLAATPAGQELGEQLGLSKNKVRWAHERYMVITAIARYTGGETFGLDTDASWPALEAGARAFIEHVKAKSR